MKAIVKNRKEEGFDYQEVEIPHVGPKDVLIRVKVAGICGSDLNFYEWNTWCEEVVKGLPFIPGHECSGEVVKVGSQVKLFTEKDRVSVETHLPCGKCFQCRDGRPNICQNMELFGHTFDGCFAEYCNVPETIVEKVADELPWEYAALLEPIGIPLRAVGEGQVGGELGIAQRIVQWHVVMAVSFLMIIPCIILFFFAQRVFMQGITSAGIK